MYTSIHPVNLSHDCEVSDSGEDGWGDGHFCDTLVAAALSRYFWCTHGNKEIGQATGSP
ncbi:Hypothetical predicted protein, partial [Marmota monax]